MLQFSDSYVSGPGTHSFTFPRISSVSKPLAGDTEFVKKANFTNDGKIVESNILFNRYPFFKSFKEKLCPLGKMEIVLSIEQDDFLMWINPDAAVNANKRRVIITKLILWVPKLELTSLGKKIILIKLLILINGLLVKLVLHIKKILMQLKDYSILQMQLQSLDM